MSTNRSKKRRAKAHSLRLEAAQATPFLCHETQAAHNWRREYVGKISGSTIADTGCNDIRDSTIGIRQANTARRLHKRYGAMLPLARTSATTKHDARVNATVGRINKDIQLLGERSSLHEAIEQALTVVNAGYDLLVWRYAYHYSRRQWLKSSEARFIAKLGYEQAERGLRRLNEQSASEVLTSIQKAFENSLK